MMLNQAFLAELKHESIGTRKMLERVPMDKLAWKPHVKSKSLEELAKHVANLPTFILAAITADERDLSKPAPPAPILSSTEDLLTRFDKHILDATNALEGATEDKLMTPWTLRRAEHIIFTLPKAAVIRNLYFNHNVHHRGQLSVYLRLLDIPVPGMYGPSADEA